MTIKNATQISTKKGDSGQSRNYSNEAFSKDDILFDTLGTIDELSSLLGLTYHHTNYEKIKTIQTTLQAINALIATNPTAQEAYQRLRQINEQDLTFIEEEEQSLLNECHIEPQFVLPGSDTSHPGAYFDLSRAVTRRAERTLVRFINVTQREDLSMVLKYLNRLSDLFFILARYYVTSEK